jgi:2'-5' RNA ligase
MPSKGGDSGATPAPRPQAVKATMKGADDTGVMIALYPDAAAAQQLAAQPGVTEPIQEIHLTLAFLGDSSEAPLETNRDRLTQAVQDWAAEHGQPLKGIINGLGRFFHSEADGTNAVFVSPDVPGLPELRQSLCDWIERSGFDYAQNHGFTPHLTVAYVPEDAPTPPIRVEIPVTFDRVSLVWGSERTDYPMGTVAATKAHSPLARRLHDKATLARAKKLYEEALTSAE